MKNNISPEEKLLRLIREEKKTTPAIPLPHLSGSEPKSIVKQNNFAPLLRINWNYSFINKLIPKIFIASCIYLLITFIYPHLALKKINLPPAESGKTNGPALPQKEKIKPFEFYSQAAGQRQIFEAATAQEIIVPAIKGEAESIKDISLVGVISDENPQAIIEDKKTQKTYTVSKGQSVGDFQIEDIQEGKVILNSKGRRYEINI